MIRSLLFVPGDSSRKLDKASATSADALIVDLEDAVAPDNKDAARAMTADFLAQPRGARKVFVRINAFDTGLVLRDLTAIMPGRPDGIMLPKSNAAADVITLGHYLDAFEANYGWVAGSTSIIPIATETPLGVLNLASYVGSSSRLWGIMWAAEDLAGAMGASGNRTAGRYRSPFRQARDQCLFAATAAGVVPIDAVYVDVKDLAGLEAETVEGRMDGFTAKAAIHPAHCDIINTAFLPTEDEISWARAVLDVLARSTGGGVATLDGKMVDKPHEVQARQILQSAGL